MNIVGTANAQRVCGDLVLGLAQSLARTASPRHTKWPVCRNIREPARRFLNRVRPFDPARGHPSQLREKHGFGEEAAMLFAFHMELASGEPAEPPNNRSTIAWASVPE
jgi:hypothetical protein